MRIISQFGADYPYDLMAISYGWNVDKTEYKIFGNFLFFAQRRPITLAVYSSLEKTEKAMELLQKAYTGRYVTNAEVSEDFDKTMQELMKHGFGTVIVRDVGDSRVEFDNLNGYFKFPSDEEIEV